MREQKLGWPRPECGQPDSWLVQHEALGASINELLNFGNISFDPSSSSGTIDESTGVPSCPNQRRNKLKALILYRRCEVATPVHHFRGMPADRCTGAGHSNCRPSGPNPLSSTPPAD